MTTTDSPEIGPLLERLMRADQLASTELAAFSNMSSDDAALVRQSWADIPPDIRAELLRTCGELAEDDALLDFIALARMGVSDADATVRQMAAAALWETESRAVIPDLLTLLDDAEEEVRATAAISLAHFVQEIELGRLNAATGDRIVAAMRARVSDDAESPLVRSRVLEAIGSLTVPWVDHLIEDAFDDEDRDMRLGAIRAMGASSRDDWNSYILDALPSDDPEIRFAAAIASGEIASDELTDTVALLLSDEDTEVMFAAMRALGEIGGAGAVRYLEDFGRAAAEEGLAIESELAEALEEARFNSIEVDID